MSLRKGTTIISGTASSASTWGNISGTLSNQTDLNTALSGKQSTIDSSNKLSADLVNDDSSTNKFVTASDKTTWSGKQDALVSGTNIKTINSTSLLGSGDITTAQVTDSYSTSTADAYSCNFTNKLVTYSTTEVKTGMKWIDSKPIYRKVVSIGSLPSSGSKSTAHGISNLDKVVNIYGFANSNTYKFPLPYTTNSNVSNIALYASTTNVVVEVGQDRSNMTGWAVLEYTKTTD